MALSLQRHELSQSETPRVRKINKLINYLLQDYSIDKASSDKTKADRMIQVVTNKERLLKTQRNIRHITQRRREIQESWENCLNAEISRYINKKRTAEKSAVKIQKIVRGFLIRIKIEPLMLVIREKNSKIIVNDLRTQTDICMLSLGTNTVPAIKLIQATYRRYLFKKKIIRLKIAYEMYLKHREEMICDFLRTVLRNYNCKIQRDYLAFLQYRIRRMEEIKENIAILTVKKIWRAKKLSFKIVKEKFIRIKRRKAAMQNKEAYQKYLATLGGASAAPKKEVKKVQESGSKDSKAMQEGQKEEETEDKEENPEEDEEYKEAQRIKNIIERKIREKIAKGKLAYAITSKKTSKMVLPMMQERALNENLEEEGIPSKLLSLTASTFAKGRSLSRESRPKTRNFSISSPTELTQRRNYDNSINLPRLSVYSPSDIPFEITPIHQVAEVENAHFLMSTITSANRIEETIIPRWKATYAKSPSRKHKRIRLNLNVEHGERTTREIKIKERTPHWIPVARRFSDYVPALDNSGYVPRKWEPLCLNRRILQTADAAAGNKRHRMTESESPQTAISNRMEAPRGHGRPQYLKKDFHTSISPSTQDPSIDFMNF